MVFDVGETLIDETRIFARWADRLGVPQLTFFGILGGVLQQGRPLMDAFHLVDPSFRFEAEIARWRAEEPGSLREGFDDADLYPDVRPALDALHAAGLRVLIAGNQPVEAGPALAAMDLPVAGVYLSEVWGVEKPDPEFFTRVEAAAGLPAAEILYVGDRLDNDVLPAQRAGMRAALLRRGMWGYLHAESAEARRADLVADGLAPIAAWIAAENAR
ncbi:HAD superfamily hydrolase (TIGR01549 family) [Murinocardiopsis flavida]|uniref:HAD superfamily hydrolase (TIGR01549 family) n=1 Tax=Murinocardiopsis flavida TaxID=645275 RepID=A0A2P8DJU9_9ACTN|nr:HAD superfamily hydrolase (TIGR01549 family) [Murinocardiopsis flavida]